MAGSTGQFSALQSVRGCKCQQHGEEASSHVGEHQTKKSTVTIIPIREKSTSYIFSMNFYFRIFLNDRKLVNR